MKHFCVKSTHLLVIKLAVFLVIVFPCESFSSVITRPANWPWRAVNVTFPEGRPADLVRFKSTLDINAVRFHVRINQYIRESNTDKEKAFEDSLNWLGMMLDECRRLGITSIVNYSQFPVGSTDNEFMTSSRFWDNQKQLDEVISVVERLAIRLHDRGNELAAYDIISEPLVLVDGMAATPTTWPMLSKQIVMTINKFDPNRWVVVAPGPGGGPEGYQEFSPPDGGNIIFGLHMYTPHAFTHQGISDRVANKTYPGLVKFTYWNKLQLHSKLKPVLKTQQAFNRLVFVGEFSAIRWADGGEQYIRDLSSIFDEYGWGWAYFSGTGWHGWNPDYNQNYPGKDGAGMWKSDYVGNSSVRWNTLRDIFRVENERDMSQ